MKKMLSSVFCGVLLTYLAIGAFAQEVEVPLIGVLEKTQKAEQLLLNMACRTSVTREDFDEKSKGWILSSTFMTENVPPGRYRWVQENFDTPTKRRIEMVTVDGRRYRKVDEGSWEEVALPPAPNSGSALSGMSIRPAPMSSTAKLIEQITIDSRNVSVYEVRTVPTGAANEPKAETRAVRYWLRDDGMLLKKIEEAGELIKTPARRVTTRYEYDNIKIEAPIK